MDTLPDDAAPLYEKVKTLVLDKIRSGAWPSNSRLPSENMLVAQLGLSRMTVNRALRELTAAGILRRIQGVGTFVAPARPQSTLIEVTSIAAEIAARGGRHHAAVLVLETVARPAPDVVLAFEFDAMRPVDHSVILHHEDGVPVQIEERHVNPALVPDYTQQDFTAMTTFDYLQHATPMTEVEHLIGAVPAGSQAAQRLGIAPGSCCLVLHRKTWTGRVVATVNSFTYVGERSWLGSRYALQAGRP